MLINRSANEADSLKYFVLYTTIASYFKVVWSNSTYHMQYLGHAPPEKNAKLDARRSLLRPFLGPITYVQQFFGLNQISIVATHLFCE